MERENPIVWRAVQGKDWLHFTQVFPFEGSALSALLLSEESFPALEEYTNMFCPTEKPPW